MSLIDMTCSFHRGNLPVLTATRQAADPATTPITSQTLMLSFMVPPERRSWNTRLAILASHVLPRAVEEDISVNSPRHLSGLPIASCY
ncbi:hypothetical protein NEUTE1DRAFT_115686 [Neurospora tetrasperma FGSC 2508]|uniref:Uncharacterized protein n=1 Tax=Neurospora tetrasperma (strain FGSC 2508 / ATCC MYA-4615 / P0657) TaxID=510951 RepID=F8MBQ6_NEUT8|nr:uncharacterized protein NEUTE1DRAFT_115686 [Neurospora tetrasperma FGSC 2508]EGO60314.1 hypothetical protein NEUTE1DRAFT_115686 [Neurospora tetrasperma FGSC 2508]EGZ75717.1 hypothetical protein NEUTE2DRAFT_143794 [Neurospora tetrasperma FGSC 2509]